MDKNVWLPAVVGVGGALLVDTAVPRSQRTMALAGVAAASLATWYFTRPPEPSSNPQDYASSAPTSGLGRTTARRRWRV